jgi:dTDP-4-amino-4,6-dideoxygalactose transaminase
VEDEKASSRVEKMKGKPAVDGVRYKYGFTEDHKNAALRVLNSNSGFIAGPENEAFEKEIAHYCGTKYAVTVSSGTAALHLALLACGIKPGDEIITVSNSFTSSADVILLCGAIPVFVDIEPVSFNMQTNMIEDKVTDRTKAIVAVHFGGHPVDIDPINELARKHQLHVVEDAAQAFGATYKGRRIGGLGKIGIVSFVHHKHVTVFGDGGAVLTNDENLAYKVRLLSNHGRGSQYYARDSLGIPKNVNEVAGYNYRLSELHAALGRVSLKHFVEERTGLKRRLKTAGLYHRSLEQLEFLQLPASYDWATHSYLRYLMLAPDRDGLYAHLKSKAIEVSIHYRVPIHLLPYYADPFNYRRGQLPVTEKYCERTISLPMSPPGYTQDEIEYVSDRIKEFYAQHPPQHPGHLKQLAT